MRKGLSILITQYNILKDIIWFVTKITTNKIYIPQSLKRVFSWYHEYLLHMEQTRTKRLSWNDMAWSYTRCWTFIDWLCSPCQVYQMTKEERTRKKYGQIPLNIAESGIVSLSNGLCGSGETFPFTILYCFMQ
jgi:hypothetical protein